MLTVILKLPTYKLETLTKPSAFVETVTTSSPDFSSLTTTEAPSSGIEVVPSETFISMKDTKGICETILLGFSLRGPTCWSSKLL